MHAGFLIRVANRQRFSRPRLQMVVLVQSNVTRYNEELHMLYKKNVQKGQKAQTSPSNGVPQALISHALKGSTVTLPTVKESQPPH